MSNNPLKIKALEETGLEIVERIPVELPAPSTAIKYLRTKKQKMGHLLKLDGR
ncbi:MAG: hypothetical protein ACRD4L_11900 [Pyrinomonadaceae bacterium]